jgi:hypothetical protein
MKHLARYLLTLGLLLTTTSHAMGMLRHGYNPLFTALNSLALPDLPAEMRVTAEIKIPQKNGVKSIAKFLYFKKKSNDLISTPGGLIAGHSDAARHDLEIVLYDIDYVAGDAIFTWEAHDTKSIVTGIARIPFDESSTKTYPLSIHDASNKPILLTITTTITP